MKALNPPKEKPTVILDENEAEDKDDGEKEEEKNSKDMLDFLGVENKKKIEQHWGDKGDDEIGANQNKSKRKSVSALSCRSKRKSNKDSGK